MRAELRGDVSLNNMCPMLNALTDVVAGISTT